MPAAKCRWCSRPCTPDAEGYCSDECREVRERMMALYPEAVEHTPGFAVDWEGYIYFAGAFFGELRAALGESKPDALAFVTGRSGQYPDWCALLGVPDAGALAENLLGRWGQAYVADLALLGPPAPPAAVNGRQDPRCAIETCRETDPAKFNRRGSGYRSYCRQCEARMLSEYRARRKAKLQEARA